MSGKPSKKRTLERCDDKECIDKVLGNHCHDYEHTYEMLNGQQTMIIDELKYYGDGRDHKTYTVKQ